MKGLRVLVVDDSEYNQRLLEKILIRIGLTVTVVDDGQEALAALAKEQFAAILMDVLLPGLDGYEVCRLLKKNARTKDIPVIFLTGKSQTVDIVTGFEAGGSDYITKPFNSLELTARIRNHLELKKSRDKISQLNEGLKNDFALAAKLQRELLPPDLDDWRVTIKTIYEPYRIVSGDFYNYLWSGDGTKLRGYLLDITGHGIATALQISALNVLFREAIAKEMSGQEMLTWLNDKVCSYFHEEYFAAVFYYEIDFKSALLTYVSGGINCFLASSSFLQGLIKAPGSLVGIDKALPFEQHSIPIKSGDTFYFISDGLLDLLGQDISLNLGDFAGTVKKLEETARNSQRWDDASGVCLEIGNLPLILLGE